MSGLGKEFLDIQATIECRFTLKHLGDMMRTYMMKNLNAYIVYNLDKGPKISLKIFKLKNCLFAATNTVKNNDKEKRLYSG